MKVFYGLMGNASEFLKELTLVESTNHGWTEKYLDNRSGQHWLKYMVDRDTGRYFNLMLISPRPTTEEIIDLALTSNDNDEVEGASHRLLIDEEDEMMEFRPQLIEKIKAIDISKLSSNERKRIKTIILNSHLTDRINKRDIVGKNSNQVQADYDFFISIGEYAEKLLKELK